MNINDNFFLHSFFFCVDGFDIDRQADIHLLPKVMIMKWEQNPNFRV